MISTTGHKGNKGKERWLRIFPGYLNKAGWYLSGVAGGFKPVWGVRRCDQRYVWRLWQFTGSAGYDGLLWGTKFCQLLYVGLRGTEFYQTFPSHPPDGCRFPCVLDKMAVKQGGSSHIFKDCSFLPLGVAFFIGNAPYGI